MGNPAPPQVVVGRYVVYDEIASGGMATVHLGRLMGSVGFSRVVAIKRLRAQFAKDPEFAEMLLNEARLAARIRHPNVVGTIDVVATKEELLLVMEYVHGASLSRLSRSTGGSRQRAAPAVAVALLLDALHGLHAAHESCDERGEPLGVVHRDVSPQNILVGTDGIARAADFGIAKATSLTATTRDGAIKGKLAYMAPEQLRSGSVDRRTDVFAASIVLWETLTGERLFAASDTGETVTRILSAAIPRPSEKADGIPSTLDEVVLRGLARDPSDRFASAREMATALESALSPAGRATAAKWVEEALGDALRVQSARLAEIESSSPDHGVIPLARSEAKTEELHAPTLVDAAPAAAAVPTQAAREAHEEGRASRRKVAPRVGVVLAALGVAAVVWFSLHATSRLSPPLTTSASANVPSPPPSSTEPVDADGTVDRALSTAPSAPSAPLPTVQGNVGGHPTPRSASGATRVSGDCTPPYFWDSARKIRVYKEHCFK